MPNKTTQISGRSVRTKPFQADGSVLPMNVWKQYARRQIQLNVALLPSSADQEGIPSVLIEGTKLSLECLGNLLLAVAADEDCGYGISPQGPGSAFFNKSSQLGIYLHRLPCVNDKFGGVAAPHGKTKATTRQKRPTSKLSQS